ncbi:MAG: hypothetical protein AAF252_01285 [Pseudomonadota bacterium]
MQQEAKEYLELVKNDLFTSRIEWRLYRSLFGTNPETVDLLNRVSGPTANTLERVLFERTLLNIRKLNDPPESKRHQTRSVSVKGFPKFFFKDDHKLAELVEQSDKAASFAKSWSNKKIAHSDVSYKSGTAHLEKASRSRVELALDAIAAVAKFVSSHYFNTTIVTHPIPALNDDRRFLEALFLGDLAVFEHNSERKRYLDSRQYEALNRMREQDRTRFPEWLHREDPPMDTD